LKVEDDAVVMCTGVILYGSQSSQVNGDYLSLNLVDGVLQLRYDLGSGSAHIVYVSSRALGQFNAYFTPGTGAKYCDEYVWSVCPLA